ncbi:MAG TPA: class I SAM-dependent methyltransferase [Fimbriimonadales bacterium]|nr:class I SAM-dependent methyltransferase [Fimbriimonadales bacterium]
MKYKREDRTISGGRKLYLYTFEESAKDWEKKQTYFWSAVADTWRNRHEIIERRFEPVTKCMLEELGKGIGRLLDLGCGACTIPYPESWEVYGVDLSHAMVKGRPKMVVGSLLALPFRNEVFERAFSRLAMMLVASPIVAFREVFRVLKKDGRFVFSVWGAREENLTQVTISRILFPRAGLRMPSPFDPGPFRLSDPEEVRALLQKVGFCDWKSQSIEMRYLAELSAREAVEAIIEMGGPFRTALERIEPSERTKVLEEIEREVEKIDRTGKIIVWSAKKP